MRPNDRDHRIGGIENTKGFYFMKLLPILQIT